jgi:FPC/CPF motif-containing protein YcgG
MNQMQSRIISQSGVAESPAQWHRQLLLDIESRLAGDSEFPCVFAKNAFRKQSLKFIFVEDMDEPGLRCLAAGLEEYVQLAKNWDGSIDTAYPLLVGFSLAAARARTVEGYHAIGWRVLQRLHELDPIPWPAGVGKDPDSDSWSMCFNGMALFCNMSSPAHRVRQSRNLGEHFALVINPRERFDVFAGDSPGGRSVRANIRRRIERYDGVAHAVQLGTYGAGSREWWQYGLVEENIQRTDRCPFVFRHAPDDDHGEHAGQADISDGGWVVE